MKNLNTQIAKPSKLKFHDSEDEEEDEEEEEEEVESSSDEEQEEEIERELADVTFEELHKARSDGSHSIHLKENKQKKTGRANKNRPMEVSCTKPVGRFREVVQAPKKVIRDPRFESLCGDLYPEVFRKRYNFLYENDFPAEKEELRKKLKKSSDPKAIEEIKSRISWIDKEMKSGSTKRKENSILTEHKRKEKEAANHGKKFYYLKKSEIRKQRNIEKYHELKASGDGKVEAYMEKKRRRNAAKDQRHMPYRRPEQN